MCAAFAGRSRRRGSNSLVRDDEPAAVPQPVYSNRICGFRRSYCGLYRRSLCHDGDRYVLLLLFVAPLFSLWAYAFSGQSAGCAARRECRFAGTSYTKGLLSVRQRQNHLLFTESCYRSFLQRERDRAAGKRQIDARLTSTCAARRQYGDCLLYPSRCV